MRRKRAKQWPRRIVAALRAGFGAAVIATLGNIGCSSQFSPALSSRTQATPSRSAAVVESQPLPAVSARVRAALERTNHRSRIEQIELRRLYEPGGYAPLWVDASGLPKTIADDALRPFSQADGEGREPEDYDLRCGR